MGKTEKEAREMWCPFSRIPGTVSFRETPEGPERRHYVGGQNRGLQTGIPLSSCLCVASGCMAWRVSKTEAVDSGKQMVVRNADGSRSIAKGPRDQIQYGYCGLAGSPHD